MPEEAGESDAPTAQTQPLASLDSVLAEQYEEQYEEQCGEQYEEQCGEEGDAAKAGACSPSMYTPFGAWGGGGGCTDLRILRIRLVCASRGGG